MVKILTKIIKYSVLMLNYGLYKTKWLRKDMKSVKTGSFMFAYFEFSMPAIEVYKIHGEPRFYIHGVINLRKSG